MFESKQELVKFIENRFNEDETNTILYYIRNESYEKIIPNPIEHINYIISLLETFNWEQGTEQIIMRDKLEEIEISRIGKIDVIDHEFLLLEGKFNQSKRDLWEFSEKIKTLKKLVLSLEKHENKKDSLNHFLTDDKEINIQLLEPEKSNNKSDYEKATQIIYEKCKKYKMDFGKINSSKINAFIEEIHKSEKISKSINRKDFTKYVCTYIKGKDSELCPFTFETVYKA